MPKERKPPHPSRAKVTYAAVPVEYAKLLRELAAPGEKHEGRSIAFLTRLAVRAFLAAEGKVDEKGRPVGG
jgi:hypothetical protein